MTDRDRWISKFLRRVHFGQWLHRAADWLAAYLFAVGSLVLVGKLILPQFWPKPTVEGLNEYWTQVALLGSVVVVGTIPVLLIAWLLSKRNRFTRSESVAFLDRKLNAGGLLMTMTEAPDEVWEERLPKVEQQWRNSLPRFRPVRFARLLVLPLAFIIGTAFVPLREARTETTLRDTVGRQAAQQLEEMLEQLDEAAILEEEEKEKLREEIEKLTEETKKNPLTHERWETVDSLEERMRLHLDKTAMTVAKGQEATASLLKATSGDAPEMSLERMEQLQKDVLEALQKISKSGKFSGASAKLRSQLQRLTKNGRLKLPSDPAERQKMLDDLQEFLDQEYDKLSKLRKQCSGDKCPYCGGKQQGGT